MNKIYWNCKFKRTCEQYSLLKSLRGGCVCVSVWWGILAPIGHAVGALWAGRGVWWENDSM